MTEINRFNIRVYGLLIIDQKILLADEVMREYSFTKFPGGGLEYGEGLQDALKREYQEELGIEIQIDELFYINDFFQQSAFKKSDQLISVYYKVSSKETAAIEAKIQTGYQTVAEQHQIRFYWQSLNSLHEGQLTFPIDKLIVQQLLKAS